MKGISRRVALRVAVVVAMATTALQAQDGPKWDENHWTDWIVEQHEAEEWQENFRTPDGSYVDILTPTHAIEVDWARKWKEAVGQSLFYAIATGKEPGIILLVKDWKTERTYYLRCLVVCAKHGIELVTVDASKAKK